MAVKPGFIYLLIHPSDPLLIKVGMTTRDPKVRLKEHNTQFDKVAGKVVESTGKLWEIKEYFAVEDTYHAESAFFQRSPLTEIPHMLADELIKLDEKHITWDWVNQGLELAKAAGIRANRNAAPIPKAKPKRGAKWIIEQLEGTRIKPVKGAGNGIMKVAFECSSGHVFKLDGNTLVRFKCCPLCQPESFDAYTLRRVETIES